MTKFAYCKNCDAHTGWYIGKREIACDECEEMWLEEPSETDLGIVTDDSVLCVPCGQFSNGDFATRDGYPDGFTCADCGTVVL